MNAFTELVFSLYREYIASQQSGLKLPDIEIVAVKEELLMEWDRAKIAGEDKTQIEHLLSQVDFLLYDMNPDKEKPIPYQMLFDFCEN